MARMSIGPPISVFTKPEVEKLVRDACWSHVGILPCDIEDAYLVHQAEGRDTVLMSEAEKEALARKHELPIGLVEFVGGLESMAEDIRKRSYVKVAENVLAFGCSVGEEDRDSFETTLKRARRKHDRFRSPEGFFRDHRHWRRLDTLFDRWAKKHKRTRPRIERDLSSVEDFASTFVRFCSVVPNTPRLIEGDIVSEQEAIAIVRNFSQSKQKVSLDKKSSSRKRKPKKSSSRKRKPKKSSSKKRKPKPRGFVSRKRRPKKKRVR